ncbi:MAG: DHH family phosphoesterase [Clostridia bacterium]|nr:DHH family phosphoesterase [Clostridia bacterium]
MSNKKHDLFRQLEELPSMLYMLFAIVALTILIALCTYTAIPVAIIGLVIILLYAAASFTVYFISHRRLKRLRIENEAFEEQRDQVIRAFRDSVDFPYAVLNEDAVIVTVNKAMKALGNFGETVYGTPLSELCDLTPKQLAYLAKAEDEEEALPLLQRPSITVGERKFVPECAPLVSGSSRFYLLALHDITELSDLNTLYHNNTCAVAYIVLDNLDELAQYVKVSYQVETRDTEAILRAWASSMGAMILEYDRNKYVMFFSREEMANCIKTRFDVLDRIRNIRLGESNTPITVSIGISVMGKTLAEREKDALSALDMALLRGGDQVALKNDTGTYFFGGRTKSPQKKSKTDSRVVTDQLCALIKSAPNVLIMGHSNPDFDSIGSCVGLSVLARHMGVPAKIVVDTSSENFKACTGRLCELSDYQNMFINGVEGMALSSYGTLLIIADANNLSILESPELAGNAFRTAIIDHHIKQQFENEPKLSYIDHTASSTCELVSEILEGILPDGALRSEEANVMMAGIMVDTKNFTRNVGPRTFSAALYLRNAGANTEYVRTFFEQNFADYLSEAQFGSEAQIYRDQFAITALTGSGSAGDRIAAAKAADRLLTVRGVNAAFAMIQPSDTIFVSGRSNGTVNVQLILEKLGGGGHFDMAGAALRDHSLEEAKALLQDAIDQYLEDVKAKKQNT